MIIFLVLALAAAAPVAHTPDGDLLGTTLTVPGTSLACNAFLGVEYAESVSGPSRWTYVRLGRWAVLALC
jgi:hypothetical protein